MLGDKQVVGVRELSRTNDALQHVSPESTDRTGVGSNPATQPLALRMPHDDSRFDFGHSLDPLGNQSLATRSHLAPRAPRLFFDDARLPHDLFGPSRSSMPHEYFDAPKARAPYQARHACYVSPAVSGYREPRCYVVNRWQFGICAPRVCASPMMHLHFIRRECETCIDAERVRILARFLGLLAAFTRLRRCVVDA